MHATPILKTLIAVALSLGVAACGGGGSDVNITTPSSAPAPAPAASAPAPAASSPTAGEAAWPVAAYRYWMATNAYDAMGTTTLNADRSFVVSNLSLKFALPYTAGCSIGSGLCAERLAASAVMACPQNQPGVVLVDSRAKAVPDLSVLNGKTFGAVFNCDGYSTATATISATGLLTVVDGQDYPIGQIADAITNGGFTVLCIETPNGQRHVLIERDAATGWIAMYIEK